MTLSRKELKTTNKEYMLIEIIIVYFAIGFLWALFALYKQIKLYGRSWKHIVFCAILNLAIWPVAVFMAIKKFVEKDIDK